MAEPVPLGQLAKTDERDAVHLAIIPCVLGDNQLYIGRGTRVSIEFREGVAVATPAYNDGHGIVDPFLNEDPQPGQRFYVLLHPNTITSLRHQWTHPELPELNPPEKPDLSDPATMIRVCLDELELRGEAIEASRFKDAMGIDSPQKRITKFAESIGQTYSSLMEAARKTCQGEFTTPIYANTESYKAASSSEWDQFWEDYESVTGTNVSDRKREIPFSCAC